MKLIIEATERISRVVKSTKKPKPRTCRKCGCTDLKACIEFDEKGRGFPCSWTAPAARPR